MICLIFSTNFTSLDFFCASLLTAFIQIHWHCFRATTQIAPILKFSYSPTCTNSDWASVEPSNSINFSPPPKKTRTTTVHCFPPGPASFLLVLFLIFFFVFLLFRRDLFFALPGAYIILENPTNTRTSPWEVGAGVRQTNMAEKLRIFRSFDNRLSWFRISSGSQHPNTGT